MDHGYFPTMRNDYRVGALPSCHHFPKDSTYVRIHCERLADVWGDSLLLVRTEKKLLGYAN